MNKNKNFIDFIITTIGTAITAFAINMIIAPVGILSGGLTGISQLINHFVNIDVGMLYLILNIPLIIMGYKYLGKRFVFLTVYSTVLISILMMYIPTQSIWTDNVMLSAVFGGAILAFGAGIVLKRGGSQGGIDIIARIVASKSDVSVGKVSLVISGLIVAFSGLLFGGEIALFTIIQLFCSSQVLDYVLNHVNRVSLMIVSEKGEEISRKINVDCARGTTYWHGNGGYTSTDKTIVFCVVTKGEIERMKKMISTIDENAFISSNATNQVIGRFNRVW